MSLEDQLAKLRDATAKRRPPEQLAIMHHATDALRASGILDGVPKVGDSLPAFSLTNAQGVEIHSDDLLSHGPLVLTVFRGVW
jgi:hypothetical protein